MVGHQLVLRFLGLKLLGTLADGAGQGSMFMASARMDGHKLGFLRGRLQTILLLKFVARTAGPGLPLLPGTLQAPAPNPDPGRCYHHAAPETEPHSR